MVDASKPESPPSRVIPVLIALFLSAILPVIGAFIFSPSLAQYINNFPKIPSTFEIAHFSLSVFVVYSLLSSMICGAVVLVILRSNLVFCMRTRYALPRFGWFGAITIVVSWSLAWSRIEWFSFLQLHTFTLLWISYIVFVNGLIYSRTGQSPLTHHTKEYFASFLLSAIFWWTFEVINRFSQNWIYLGIEHFDTISYIIFASISFSTVLPSIWATRELVSSCCTRQSMPSSFSDDPLDRDPPTARPMFCAFFIALILMVLLPLYPNWLFPVVWIGPLVIMTYTLSKSSVPTLISPYFQKRPPLSHHTKVAYWALSGLICGMLWECWNYWSLAKWEYRIPFVEQFYIFEMPLLGYVGYLPFGILCGVIVETLWNKEGE